MCTLTENSTHMIEINFASLSEICLALFQLHNI